MGSAFLVLHDISLSCKAPGTRKMIGGSSNHKESKGKYNIKDDTDIEALLKYLNEVYPVSKVGKKYKYKLDEIEKKSKQKDLTIVQIDTIGVSCNLGVITNEAIVGDAVLGNYQGEVADSGGDRRFAFLLGNQFIDASYEFNWTRFINHSSFSFNCQAREKKGKIEIVALRPIGVSEQLLLDYGDEYKYSGHLLYLYPVDDCIRSGVQFTCKFPLQELFDDSMLQVFNLTSDESYCKCTKLFKEIKDKGDSSNIKIEKEDVDLPCHFFTCEELITKERVTALMFACYKGYLKVVSVLLRNNADPLRATVCGGRNSMFFTILGVGKRTDKITILNLLLESIPKYYVQDMFQFLFCKKDLQSKSLSTYIIEKGLASSMFKIFNEKVFRNCELLNQHSEMFLPLLEKCNQILDLNLKPTEFNISAFFNKSSSSTQKTKTFFTIKEIKHDNYSLVKSEIDKITDTKCIKEVLERYDKRLTYKQSVLMYREVFAHCVCYIGDDQSDFEILKANSVLNYFQDKVIFWREKMEIFYYAFQNCVSWHLENYKDTVWSSLPAFNYLKKSITDYEFKLILYERSAGDNFRKKFIGLNQQVDHSLEQIDVENVISQVRRK